MPRQLGNRGRAGFRGLLRYTLAVKLSILLAVVNFASCISISRFKTTFILHVNLLLRTLIHQKNPILPLACLLYNATIPL